MHFYFYKIFQAPELLTAKIFFDGKKIRPGKV